MPFWRDLPKVKYWRFRTIWHPITFTLLQIKKFCAKIIFKWSKVYQFWTYMAENGKFKITHIFFLVLDLARFATEFFHSKVKTAGISVHSLDSTYPILFVYFQRWFFFSIIFFWNCGFFCHSVLFILIQPCILQYHITYCTSEVSIRIVQLI